MTAVPATTIFTTRSSRLGGVPMARMREIVIDAAQAAPLARFWAAVLDGYHVRAYDDAEIARLATLGHTPETDPSVAVDGPGPTIFVQEVPEPKITKNRVHLDVETADRAADVQRLTALGGSVLDTYDDWTVMLDPEGNEFCLADPAS